MSVCCAKFATSRILLEWIKFLSLIMKMQKNLNSKCTEKRSQVKSDPIFPHDPNVNKNIIFTLPHSEYKVTLEYRVVEMIFSCEFKKQRTKYPP